MIWICAYICFMKTRLNITIEDSVLNLAKAYAERENKSLSELIEAYLANITQPVKKKSIIDFVEGMNLPEDTRKTDPMDDYYKDIEKKYGV